MNNLALVVPHDAYINQWAWAVHMHVSSSMRLRSSSSTVPMKHGAGHGFGAGEDAHDALLHRRRSPTKRTTDQMRVTVRCAWAWVCS